jgi:CRISPR-associated protein (TIGR02584 family)
VITVREAFSARQYGASITLRVHHILVDCQPAEDVETPAASAAAFRELYRLVRAHKQQERQVHLCIAGGRKNLAIFGMVTAQLLFDASDCLWHLYSAVILKQQTAAPSTR